MGQVVLVGILVIMMVGGMEVIVGAMEVAIVVLAIPVAAIVVVAIRGGDGGGGD